MSLARGGLRAKAAAGLNTGRCKDVLEATSGYSVEHRDDDAQAAGIRSRTARRLHFLSKARGILDPNADFCRRAYSRVDLHRSTASPSIPTDLVDVDPLPDLAGLERAGLLFPNLQSVRLARLDEHRRGDP